MRRIRVLLLVCAGLTSLPFPTQSADDIVVIDSPEDGSYISGVTTLKTTISRTAGPVKQVTIFADGRAVCQFDAPPYQCDWDAGAGVNEHTIRVVGTLADGRRVVQNARTRKAAYAESVDVEVVQVTATITDGRGHFVNGLSRNDFQIFEGGVPQTITHFAGENVPLDLVVAIDISESMAPAMPTVKEAVRKFLNALGENNQVTLVGFNNDLVTLARRGSTAAQRSRAVDRLEPWGGTALYDVIIRSIDSFGQQRGRRIIVIFTDGDDQSSHVTLGDLERRVEGSDATLYLVGQGLATSSVQLKRILDRIADISGGRRYIRTTSTGWIRRSARSRSPPIMRASGTRWARLSARGMPTDSFRSMPSVSAKQWRSTVAIGSRGNVRCSGNASRTIAAVRGSLRKTRARWCSRCASRQ